MPAPKYNIEELEQKLQNFISLREASEHLGINYSYLCYLVRKHNIKAPNGRKIKLNYYSRYDKLVDKVNETPLFSDEVPLRRSQIKTWRAYAYWNANISIRKFAFRKNGVHFTIFFKEGDEWKAFKKIIERYPAILEITPRILYKELKRLFGKQFYSDRGAWYYKNPTTGYKYRIKRPKEEYINDIQRLDDKTVVGNFVVMKFITARRNRTTRYKYKYLAEEIKYLFKHYKGDGIPVFYANAGNKKDAINMITSLRRYLEEDFTLYQRGSVVFVSRKSDFFGVVPLPRSDSLKSKEVS